MMAVEITTQPTFRAGTPTLVFEGQYFRDIVPSEANYDITPDGRRFLMIKESEQEGGPMIKESEQEGGPRQINVVLNWFEELKRLVPTKQN